MGLTVPYTGTRWGVGEKKIFISQTSNDMFLVGIETKGVRIVRVWQVHL